MGFKTWQAALFRFLLIYLSVNVFLILNLILYGPFTFSNYAKRAALIGVSGIIVTLMMTRFGGGHVEDGTFYAADDDVEIKRKTRRNWMYAALWTAIVLLLTAGVWQLYF